MNERALTEDEWFRVTLANVAAIDDVAFSVNGAAIRCHIGEAVGAAAGGDVVQAFAFALAKRSYGPLMLATRPGARLDAT